MMQELQAFEFDAGERVWEPTGSAGAPDPANPANPANPADSRDPGDVPGTLGVVTFNVWFDSYEREARWRALLAEVERCRPDVIGFQEVTRPFLALVREQGWIRDHYALSDPDGRTFGRYGVMLLSRRRPRRLTLHEMPSQMGRALLVAELPGSLAVSTIHLESLRPSAAVRDVQFARCVEILARHDHAVLMGDMNFCSSWRDENDRIPAEYIDVWPHLHPGDAGYTEDSDVNAMLQLYERRDKKVRYDRVLLRSAGQVWRPVHMERLGTRPIGDDPLVFPSDHFGLYARFERTGGFSSP